MINLIITTKNGASGSKQFRNMAQGLAYAYANGVYHAALKIEFIDMDEALNIKANDEKKDVEKDDKSTKRENKNTFTPDVIKDNEIKKPLEEMSKKELIELAKTFNIRIGAFDNEAKIIAAIKAAQDADKSNKSEVLGKSLEEMADLELIDRAAELGVDENIDKREDIIAAILEAEAKGEKLDNQN